MSKASQFKATGFVDNLDFLRPVEERLNSASVLKNNPEVDEIIKLIDPRFA